MKLTVGILIGFILSASAAVAGSVDELRLLDQSRGKAGAVVSVTPIFGQLVRMSYPQGFVLANEKANSASYIQELVQRGENVEHWTQMITVSGYKDLGASPQFTPAGLLTIIADGFRRACPNSFLERPLRDSKLEGLDTAAAVLSCGLSPTTGGRTSETALIAVIRGRADAYTIQWAERVAPSKVPMEIELPTWQARFGTLNPIRLCPIVSGEKAPYPSCVGAK